MVLKTKNLFGEIKFYESRITSKMGLNLSRGLPTK